MALSGSSLVPLDGQSLRIVFPEDMSTSVVSSKPDAVGTGSDPVGGNNT